MIVERVGRTYCCILYKMGVIGILIVVSIMIRVFGRMKVWCRELDGYQGKHLTETWLCGDRPRVRADGYACILPWRLTTLL